MTLYRTAKDLSGQRFCRLVALHPAGTSCGGHVNWLCACDCGKKKVASSSNLQRGNAKSCGCLQSEGRPPVNRTHGASKTAVYGAWEQMIARCSNPSNAAYVNYGGRGIAVCDRWQRGDGSKSGFECFVADMGSRPSDTTLDRINNDGNYEPGNCRWATKIQQQNNMRSNRMVEILGRKQTVAQWCREFGRNRRMVYKRLSLGWSIQDAILKEPRGRHVS